MLGLRCCAQAFSSCGGRGYSLLQCVGFSLLWLLSLQSTGSRHAGFSSCGTWASVAVAHGLQSAGSVVVAHRLSCSAARGIFPDIGLEPASPALAGGFLTTVPPGKPTESVFKIAL